VVPVEIEIWPSERCSGPGKHSAWSSRDMTPTPTPRTHSHNGTPVSSLAEPTAAKHSETRPEQIRQGPFMPGAGAARAHPANCPPWPIAELTSRTRVFEQSGRRSLDRSSRARGPRSKLPAADQAALSTAASRAGTALAATLGSRAWTRPSTRPYPERWPGNRDESYAGKCRTCGTSRYLLASIPCAVGGW